MLKTFLASPARGAVLSVSGIMTILSCSLLPMPADAVLAPGIDWRRTDFAPTHPVTGPQTRAQSGEDWWYAHATSLDLSGTVNGYICAGYSSFVNYSLSELSTGGCLDDEPGAPTCEDFETTGNVKGATLATMSLIAPDGATRMWFNTYLEGAFNRVIQVSDGGYLAIGESAATRTASGTPLYYNPGQAGGQFTDAFGAPAACTYGQSNRHVMMVRTDANGTVLWQYLYGVMPFRNGSGTPDPMTAFAHAGQGWDVVETPTGGFRLVGNVQDPSATYLCNNSSQPLDRTFMIEVDQNGIWAWGGYFGPANFSSAGRAIARYGSGTSLRYVVSGTQYFTGSTFNPFLGCNLFQKAYVMQFDNSVAPAAPLWTTTNFDNASPAFTSSSQNNFGIAITERNAQTEILVPVIMECTGCLYASTNVGTGKVYRLDTSGTIIQTCTIGPVLAYDLRMGIHALSDGGFAVVSSRQVNPPPAPYSCYPTGYWNTDALVSRWDACGNEVWEKTFDVDDAPAAPYPLNQKKQECLYTISEGADGGLVLAGNDSENFDDAYLAKLLPENPITDDLALQDRPFDTMVEPNPDPGPMWISDDIWIRNSNDGQTTHQNPEYSPTQPVYVYIRVRNHGCAPAGGALHVYWAKASTGLGWPTQWVNYTVNGVVYGDEVPGSPLTISNLPSNTSQIVSIPWLLPNPADFTSFGADKAHFCLLGRIETSSSPPYGMTVPEGSGVNANVRNNNNIAWKNVEIVDNFVGKMQRGYVVLRNVGATSQAARLSFSLTGAQPSGSTQYLNYGTVHIELGSSLLQRWIGAGRVGQGISLYDSISVNIVSPTAWLGNLTLAAGEMQTIAARFDLWRSHLAGEDSLFNFDLTHDHSEGGLTVTDGGQRFFVNTGAAADISAVDAGNGIPVLRLLIIPMTGNSAHEIRYSLDRPGSTTLRVFDVTGRRIASLVSARSGPGAYRVRWPHVDDSGRRVSSGVYFVELRSGGRRQQGRLIVVK